MSPPHYTIILRPALEVGAKIGTQRTNRVPIVYPNLRI